MRGRPGGPHAPRKVLPLGVVFSLLFFSVSVSRFSVCVFFYDVILIKSGNCEVTTRGFGLLVSLHRRQAWQVTTCPRGWGRARLVLLLHEDPPSCQHLGFGARASCGKGPPASPCGFRAHRGSVHGGHAALPPLRPQSRGRSSSRWRPHPGVRAPPAPGGRWPVPVPALGCCCPVRGGHSSAGGWAPEPWASLLTLVTRAPRCPASPAWLCTAPLPTRSRAAVRSQLCAVFVGGCARSLRVASGPGQEAPGSSGGRPAECPPVRSRGRGSTAVGGQGCPCRHRGWGLASRR